MRRAVRQGDAVDAIPHVEHAAVPENPGQPPPATEISQFSLPR